MTYYLFPTEAECQEALDELHPLMAQVAGAHGFTIINSFDVVAKNAATGEDTTATTTKWDDPHLMTDGQWGFANIRLRFPTSYPQLEAAVGLSDPVEATSVPEDVEQ